MSQLFKRVQSSLYTLYSYIVLTFQHNFLYKHTDLQALLVTACNFFLFVCLFVNYFACYIVT